MPFCWQVPCGRIRISELAQTASEGAVLKNPHNATWAKLIAVFLSLSTYSLLVQASSEKPAVQDGARSTNSPVRVSNAWARATVPGQPVAAAYFTLSSTAPVTLAYIETDVAKQVQLHDMRMVDGVMRMREQKNLELKPGRVVVLEPNGMHLMLLGLQKPLKAGETVSFTFTFIDSAQKKITSVVDVPVRPLGN